MTVKPEWVYTRQKDESKKKWKKRIRKHEQQRIEQGFSDYDWWSFDTYITEVIALAARKFRKEGMGYPAAINDDPKEAEARWNDLLKSIEKPLLAYAVDKFSVNFAESEVIHKAAEQGLKIFAKNFASFWD